MSLKFGEVKDINVGGMQIVPIRTEDDKPFYVTTGKCFSFGVKHEKKFKAASMSLKLDDESATDDNEEEYISLSIVKELIARQRKCF